MPAPNITAMSVHEGPTAGGTTVVITGTDLNSTTALWYFDAGVTAVSYVIDSSTQITATMPAHAKAAGAIYADWSGGSSALVDADRYTYDNSSTDPRVTSITPGSGTDAGGTSVVIGGVRFTGASAVDFGYSSAASFTVDSDSQITAVSPAHFASAQYIRITQGGEQNPVGWETVFVFTAPPPPPGPPTISSIVPNTGSEAGGETIDIYGTNLDTIYDLTVDGTSVGGWSGFGPTHIQYTSPAHATGVVSVVVINADGTDSAVYGYGVTPVGTLDDACPLLTIYDNTATAVLIADGFTPDANGVIWGLTKLDGWWDSTELATGTEEVWPQGEVFASSRENARKIDMELLGTTPGIPLGVLAGDAIGTAKAAFACVQVPFQVVITDGGALGPLHARVRRLDPVRVEILGARYAVKVAVTLTATDPRRYDAGNVGHA